MRKKVSPAALAGLIVGVAMMAGLSLLDRGTAVICFFAAAAIASVTLFLVSRWEGKLPDHLKGRNAKFFQDLIAEANEVHPELKLSHKVEGTIVTINNTLPDGREFFVLNVNTVSEYDGWSKKQFKAVSSMLRDLVLEGIRDYSTYLKNHMEVSHE